MPIPKAEKTAAVRGTTISRQPSFPAYAPAWQAAGAAVAEHGEPARVEPALDRDAADQVGHLRVDDLDHRRGRLLRRQPERLRDRRERLERGVGVEPDPSAEEVVRVQPAQHEIRVGDRRFVAARPVARRSGHCAGAARTDLEHAGLGLDPGDAAAAGADRGDVDHGQGDGVLREDGRVGVRRLAVDDEADVEARTAHVGRDHAVELEPLRQCAGSEHAAGRPGRKQRDAAPPRLVDRGDSAGGVHDRDRTAVASRAQPLAHPIEVPVDRRGQVCVQHGRRGALVLPQHRHEVARCGHEPAVPEPLRD
jgi:hypothetical protein